MNFTTNDGGRKAAGYKGHTGDCVARAIAITTGLPYQQVYDTLAEGNATQRAGRGRRYNHGVMRREKSGIRTAREGINTNRKWFKDYMHSLGFVWTPTMRIGSGCKVHLHEGELPRGRLVVALSKHYTAVIDGDVHDTYDPRREAHCTRQLSDGVPLQPNEWTHDGIAAHHVERRCVYGYWQLQE
jgi:hypothetical protein